MTAILTQYALDLAIGLAIGFCGGLFGISGGIIAIPTLGLLGLNEQFAQGTSMVMQLPNAIIGLYQYSRRSKLERKATLSVGAAAAPTAFLGALVATHVSSSSLRRAFALFIIAIASYTLWNALRSVRKALGQLELSVPWALAIGAFGGFLSGLFGIGGAAFAIPTLTLFFGLAQPAAQGMALALVLPTIVIGIFTYAAAGFVDWSIGVPLGIGGMLTVTAGVALAHTLPERRLRLLFCVVLYAGALSLWFKT